MRRDFKNLFGKVDCSSWRGRLAGKVCTVRTFSAAKRAEFGEQFLSAVRQALVLRRRGVALQNIALSYRLITASFGLQT